MLLIDNEFNYYVIVFYENKLNFHFLVTIILIMI